MTHSLIAKSAFRSIIQLEGTDVFLLVTETETLHKKYRVLPKNFTVRIEDGKVKFYSGHLYNEHEIQL